MEQDLEGGQEHGEQGDALGVREGLEPSGGLRIDAEVIGVALEVGDFGAGMVGGQFQLGQLAAEFALPVSESALEQVALNLGALPVGEVAILQRQRRQGGRLAGE